MSSANVRGIECQQTVFPHRCAVAFQRHRRSAFRDQPQSATDGAEIIDPGVRRIFSGKEDGLVLGDLAHQLPIMRGQRVVPSVAQGCEVVPVREIALAVKAPLQTLDMCRGGFFPERPRGSHDQRSRRRKLHPIDDGSHVAGHRVDWMGFARRPCAEL